jgi:NAD(P)-dependent dehydrogenase (short-subunit alcohol dehydrogenase family)
VQPKPAEEQVVALMGASSGCAAKHGVDGLLESLRVELKREGWPIGVTNVMPAAIATTGAGR